MFRFPLPIRIPAALVCALVVLLCSLGSPAQAGADGDPASDVLLAQDVFYPYQPKVSPALEAALERTLNAATRADGLHLKVALIGTAEELGLVPNFFGHPQAYAQFLDREISFNHPQQLLVVMPAGFGAVPASLAVGLQRVPVYARQRSNGLTRAAILAVVAIAGGRGHPIATPSLSLSSSGGSTPAALVFGLPAALLLLAGLAVMWRSRSRPAEGDED